MSDNEIIKALECCANEGFQDCENCPLNIPHQPCSKVKLPRISLDLINRQKAESERLEAQHREMCIGIKVLKKKAIQEFAERLKEKLRRNARVSPFAHNLNDVIIDNLVKEMTEKGGEAKARL